MGDYRVWLVEAFALVVVCFLATCVAVTRTNKLDTGLIVHRRVKRLIAITEIRKTMAGYSETPLVKKLGIKAGFNVAFVNAPVDFFEELTLPQDINVKSRSQKPLDFVLLFVKSEKDLQKKFSEHVRRLAPGGMIWVAWPKKSSGVTTDLSFNNVQAIGLATGLVDVKICAVNEVWSGLKFVFRLRDRDQSKVRRK